MYGVMRSAEFWARLCFSVPSMPPGVGMYALSGDPGAPVLYSSLVCIVDAVGLGWALFVGVTHYAGLYFLFKFILFISFPLSVLAKMHTLGLSVNWIGQL